MLDGREKILVVKYFSMICLFKRLCIEFFIFAVNFACASLKEFKIYKYAFIHFGFSIPNALSNISNTASFCNKICLNFNSI